MGKLWGVKRDQDRLWVQAKVSLVSEYHGLQIGTTMLVLIDSPAEITSLLCMHYQAIRSDLLLLWTGCDLSDLVLTGLD